MMNGLISFWRWWVCELQSLFGGSTQSAVSFKKSNTIILSKSGYQLVGNEHENLSLDEILIEIDIQKKPIIIRLKQGAFLKRQLSKKRLPDFHIEQIAQTDLTANTPFSPNDSYTIFGKGNGSGKQMKDRGARLSFDECCKIV